jgi:hypothetical protein
MAAIYSRQLFNKQESVPGPTTWIQEGPGTVIIHDMIYYPALVGLLPGVNQAMDVFNETAYVHYWTLLTAYLTQGSTVHWTGRIVVPAGHVLVVETESDLDSFTASGYYLTP